MSQHMSEETRQVVQAMEEATLKAVEGYRATGLPVPIWRDGKVVYLSVDEVLACRAERRRKAEADSKTQP